MPDYELWFKKEIVILLYVPLFVCVSKKEYKFQNWVQQRVSTQDLAGAELISAHRVLWFRFVTSIGLIMQQWNFSYSWAVHSAKASCVCHRALQGGGQSWVRVWEGTEQGQLQWIDRSVSQWVSQVQVVKCNSHTDIQWVPVCHCPNKWTLHQNLKCRVDSEKTELLFLSQSCSSLKS